MTNRNVTPTRKLLSRSARVYIWRSGGAAEKTATRNLPRPAKTEGAADGWRSMPCTRRSMHPPSILQYHPLYPSLPLPCPSRDVVTSHILLLRVNILQHVWRFRRDQRSASGASPAPLKIRRYFPTRRRCSRNDYPSLWINSRYAPAYPSRCEECYQVLYYIWAYKNNTCYVTVLV